MADLETVHDTFDHTGLTGVGGGGGSLVFVETVTLGSDGTITFDAIAATGKDLLIRGRVRDDAASAFAASLQMQVGASTVDSGNNYNYATIETRIGTQGVPVGDAATGAATMFVARSIMADSATAGLYSGVEIIIHDYASTSVFKVVRSSWTTYHATDPRHGQGTGHWLDSDTAIDIVTISGSSGGSLKAGSSLSLWIVDN